MFSFLAVFFFIKEGAITEFANFLIFIEIIWKFNEKKTQIIQLLQDILRILYDNIIWYYTYIYFKFLFFVFQLGYAKLHKPDIILKTLYPKA